MYPKIFVLLIITIALFGCSKQPDGISYSCSENNEVISCSIMPLNGNTEDYYVSYELTLGGVSTNKISQGKLLGVSREEPATLTFPVNRYDEYLFHMEVYSTNRTSLANVSLVRDNILGDDVMSCVPFKSMEHCPTHYDPVCAVMESHIGDIEIKEYRTFGNSCSACNSDVDGRVIGYRPWACR